MKNSLIAATAAIVVLTAQSTFAETGQHFTKDKVEKKEAMKPYPLEICIVSDDKLGEMGKPVVFVYKDQEIKICCKDCRPDFDKEPAKFLKKLSKK